MGTSKISIKIVIKGVFHAAACYQNRRHLGSRIQQPATAGADDPRRGERGAAQLQPRHRTRPHRPRQLGAQRRAACGGGSRHHGRPAGAQNPRGQICRRQGVARRRRAFRAGRRPHRTR